MDCIAVDQDMNQHVLALLVALPFQLALIPLNRRREWLTSGELRFWAVAVFVAGEIVFLSGV